MKPKQIKALAKWYGRAFADRELRSKSHGLLETIVSATPMTGNVPNTQVALQLLNAKLNSLSDQSFAFLLAHSGFIPDQFSDDSSEETLYSKLIESLVFEWGVRMGFKMVLPTAKSSTEDVTFLDGDEVVVSDAKSFRLGRSQAAPNTKDVVKPEDYHKWLARHKSRTTIGGLIVFPSKFDFQLRSDVYLYTSNSQEGRRILLLFYEHLAYLLLKKQRSAKGSVFKILKDYAKLFEMPSKKRDAYWLAIDAAIEKIVSSDDLKDFWVSTSAVVDECVRAAARRIEQRIDKVQTEERARVEAMDPALLREALIASEVDRRTRSDRRRLENIRKFRL